MNVQNTFLSNATVTHKGDKYLVLETCSRTDEMLVLRLSNKQAYHYRNGTFTPIDLEESRTDGHYFAFGVIHNWMAGNPDSTLASPEVWDRLLNRTSLNSPSEKS